MSIQQDLRPFVKSIEHLFSKEYLRKTAKETGFVKRIRSFKPEDFFMLCTLFDQSIAVKSLGKICASLSHFSSTKVSKQALDQRFTPEATTFLNKMFQDLAVQQNWLTVPLDMDKLFSRILIQDSTEIDLAGTHQDYPSANGSGAKIQFEYEFYSGMFTQLFIESGLDPDQKAAVPVEKDLRPGDLCLRDLGYFSADNIKAIDQKKAYYLLRLPSHVSIWQQDDQTDQWLRLDPVALGEQLSPGETTEFASLKIGAKKTQSFFARVIIQKLTPEQQAKREQTLHKKRQKGRSTQSAKQRNSIQILVTNISQEMIDSQGLYALYSLRWQIEILFKTWKSHFTIHENKEIKKERLECHLYGTLIRILLSSMLAFQCRYFLFKKEKFEASEYKSIGFAKEALLPLAHSLSHRAQSVLDILLTVYQNVSKNGRKDHRHRHDTPFDILGVQYEPK